MASLITETTTIPSAATAVGINGADIFNTDNFDAIDVTVDLTAFVTAAALTVSIQEWVPGKAAYVTVLSTAAIAANSTVFLRMGPGYPEVANSSRCGTLPKRFRIIAALGNGNSHTFSVDTQLTRLSR